MVSSDFPVFELLFADGWDKHYSKFDNSIKQKIWKKILQITVLANPRHLKYGEPFFVEKAGQYRICFEQVFPTARRIIFVGNHKQYEKWLASP